MRSITARTVSVLTSLSLLVGAAGFGSLAAAQSGGPTVTLASTSATTTNASSIPVTITFSESVTGFTQSDLALTNASSTSFAGTGASYTFNLMPTNDGSVTVQIPADVASSSLPSFKGNQASNVLTFTSDTQATTISNVQAAVATTTATITWNTNEAATSQVMYGPSSSYNASTTPTNSWVTSHSVNLSGLSAGTLYHFQVRSVDAAGNMATSTDGTFTTAATVAVPIISNISVTTVGTSTATITWNTDSAATTQVQYGTSTSYGSSTALNATASTTHSATLTGLAEATLYHFRVLSGNSAGTTTSADQSFVTNSTASTTPLMVTGVDSVSSVATADGTFEHGFKWVIYFTVPTNETSFRMRFNDFQVATGTGTIPTANNVRYYSAQSTNASTSAAAIVETNNDYGGAMTLTGDASATLPGRQIAVTVEVRVPVGTPAGVYSTTFGARSE